MIDLHTHSNCSDGSETPSDLIDLAHSQGLSCISLTDHDTTSGLAEASNRAAELGIRFIPGIELSCHTPKRNVHLLGYLFDPENIDLVRTIGMQQVLRANRNQHLVIKLQELNFDITLQEVLDLAGAASVGRPHFAKILVQKGYFDSIDDAFRELLGDGAPAFVERKELPVAEAIELIHRAGGLTVWAHPLRGKHIDDFAETLEYLASVGIDGVEAHYSRFTPEQRQLVKRAAKKHSLIATGGSDFHGSYKPDLALGTGSGDLQVPDQIIDEMIHRKHIFTDQ